ncbi:MAG: type IV secretory system conjugative DNA transfer family protein, partial [Pseudomonadota bacterium]
IEKAYGQNNAILDNCHVRVAFATNDERTAKRLSDALGTTTELRAMKNYAGHRLSPWLGHLMVSRQETARALLTPGEIMQLPTDDEIILASGAAPIRAQKVRYFRDTQLNARIQPPPRVAARVPSPASPDDDWSSLRPISPPQEVSQVNSSEDTEGGIRREPEVPQHEDVAPALPFPREEFADLEDEPDDEVQRTRAMQTRFRTVARQAALDPDDGIEL